MRRGVIFACAIFIMFTALTKSSDALSKCEDESIRQCTCSSGGKLGWIIVDCSHTGLNSVPENLPLNVTHLYLDSNNIVTLQNGSFGEATLPNLSFLSIRHNRLKKIDTGTFRALYKLEDLDLYNNSLKYQNSLPGSVFRPLSQSLKVLDIRMNLVNYPPSISELYNLEELKLDCLRDQPLPNEYSTLKQLRRMVFTSGRKNVGLLRENLFSVVKDLNVTEIDLAGLDIGVIDNQTFSQLRYLTKLDLSDNTMLSLQFFKFAPSLKNTSLQSLMLNNTGIGASGTSKIQEFCGLNLKVLSLDCNKIGHIEPMFKRCFPELEILSVADNYLLPDMTFWVNVMQLRNFMGINASSQYRTTKVVNRQSEISVMSQGELSRQPFRAGDICGTGMACPLWLPPKMEWIDLSYNGVRALRLPELALMRNSTLRHFYAAYSGIQTVELPVYCVHSTVSTVVPQLETIDMSNNNLQCVNASFFDGSITHCDWSSLKHLYLSNNKLGLTEGNICNEDQNNTLGFLKPLWNLRVLDLAGNTLGSESQSLSDLHVLNRLEKLDLSSNGFHNFSLDLSNMTNLQKLDLSNNNIQCLSKSTIVQLNEIKKSSSIQIDLSDNVLSCSCECLHFFLWMPRSGLDFMSNKTYKCTFKDRKVVPLNRLSFIITELESQCYRTEWLQWSIGAEICTYTLITLFCLLYRRRHDIRYFFLKLKLNQQRLAEMYDKKTYPFSAFVSCDHRDAKYFVYRKLLPNLETEETKLKFCVAQRNFLVGGTILDNVMRAIHKSKKVIFIVSQYFLQSKWCQEELLIAHQVSLERGENIIICIFMPNVKPEQLPATLHMITKTVTCLKWTPEPKVQRVFWLLLQKGLEEGHAENPFVIV